MSVNHIMTKRWGLLLLLITALSAVAHEGEEHGPQSPPVAEQTKTTLQIHEANSPQFELLLKYQPLVPHHLSPIRVFLSDYATNRPITDAKIELAFTDQYKRVAKPLASGVYEVSTQLPPGNYNPIAHITTPRQADLLVLDELKVMPPPVSASSTGSWFDAWRTGLIGGSLLLVGWLAQKYRQRTRRREVLP